jgi:hypothetical protein
VGKHYPKLRAGTLDSCLKFLMALYDTILEEISAKNYFKILLNPVSLCKFFFLL